MSTPGVNNSYDLEQSLVEPVSPTWRKRVSPRTGLWPVLVLSIPLLLSNGGYELRLWSGTVPSNRSYCGLFQYAWQNDLSCPIRLWPILVLPVPLVMWINRLDLEQSTVAPVRFHLMERSIVPYQALTHFGSPSSTCDVNQWWRAPVMPFQDLVEPINCNRNKYINVISLI
jgi:hypothetical protein